MVKQDLKNLDSDELIELLAILEEMDDSLNEQEKILKESSDNNDN